MEYYDFEMREFFDDIDENRDGFIDFVELQEFVKKDLGDCYEELDEIRKVAA